LETIDILERRYSRGDCRLRNMFRERELNKDSVHGGIVVEVFDGGQKLIDTSIPRRNKWTESYLHLGD
jgi:hypothetical protein